MLANLFQRSLFLFVGLLLLPLLFSSSSYAYFTVGESGELPKPGTYRIGAEPQIVFDDGGFDLSAFADTLLGPDGSIRGQMGVGETNFDAGVSYKWIPIPDYGNQPAVGGKAEVDWANRKSGGWTSFRIMPLVSKKFETDYGLMTPYAALPIGLNSAPWGSVTTIQLAGGSEFRNPDYPRWMYSAELGLNLNNAFTYISGNVTYFLDESEVSSKKR
jgi:hypothetical protein